jgi:chaperone required for assembly of F1-ATPase
VSEEGAPRRFYKTVGVAPQAGGFAVLLDGRTLRTPAHAPLVVPTAALAEVCAAEWEAQAELIRAETMPVTRLINVALDRTGAAREAMAEGVVKFAGTDLLCYRAEHGSLAARQAAAWDPLLVWAQRALDAPLGAAAGVIAHAQPDASLAALKAQASALDDFRLAGLAHAAGLAGSAVIAFALALGRLGGHDAFEAAALDDLYQLEIWGEDKEARQRLNNQRAEFLALEQFFTALGQPC